MPSFLRLRLRNQQNVNFHHITFFWSKQVVGPVQTTRKENGLHQGKAALAQHPHPWHPELKHPPASGSRVKITNAITHSLPPPLPSLQCPPVPHRKGLELSRWLLGFWQVPGGGGHMWDLAPHVALGTGTYYKTCRKLKAIFCPQ